MKEIWQDIKEYEGLYQVSNLGRIKRLSKPRRNYNINTKSYGIAILPDKIVKPQLNQYGYYRIGLTKNSKRTHHSVHRLVAEAFILNPDNLPCINHKDENKQNNCVDNLEWCTRKYNSNYGTCIKRRAEKYKRPIRCVETGVIYDSITMASKTTGIVLSNISAVCNHRVGYKTAGGYHWEFLKLEKKTRKRKNL